MPTGWCADCAANRVSFGPYRFPRRSARRAGSRAALARPLGLDRRTGHRAVRTEHTAIALLRPQPHAAAGALIEKPACIGRHDLRFGGPAMRAGNHRLVEHGRLQVIGRQAVADRQTKQIDHVLDVRPDEMRAENTALSSSIIVLYPYTVSATRRAVYQSGTLAAFPRSFAPCPRAAPSESPTAAIGGSVKATLGTPR